MVNDADMKAEIATLRAEIEALKTGRIKETATRSEAPSDSGDAAAPSAASPIPEQFHDLERAIRELAETVEADIAERPMISVGAAFLLGIMIGRISAR